MQKCLITRSFPLTSTKFRLVLLEQTASTQHQYQVNQAIEKPIHANRALKLSQIKNLRL